MWFSSETPAKVEECITLRARCSFYMLTINVLNTCYITSARSFTSCVCAYEYVIVCVCVCGIRACFFLLLLNRAARLLLLDFHNRRVDVRLDDFIEH